MDFPGITLVTGAAGFMGSHLVELRAASGVKVRATARPRKDTSFFDKLGVEYAGADLTKPETVPPLFDGPVDRVIHMGAICNFSTSYKKLYPTNVKGVELITGLAMKKGVKRYIHVSSTSVYGLYGGTPFREDSRRIPADSYGKSKRDGENVVFRRMEEGLPAIITRPCTVYGPRCNDGAGKAFSRPTTISAIPGDGTQKLANIRAEDVARAIDFLSRLDGIEGDVFNLVDDSRPTLEDALTLAAKTFHTKVPTTNMPLAIVKAAAVVDGFISGLKGKIPDLEYEAVKYLYNDYVVDNRRLKGTGFTYRYPDFKRSMKDMGDRFDRGLL